jgi:hypothetical protein
MGQPGQVSRTLTGLSAPRVHSCWWRPYTGGLVTARTPNGSKESGLSGCPRRGAKREVGGLLDPSRSLWPLKPRSRGLLTPVAPVVRVCSATVRIAWESASPVGNGEL